MLPVATGWARDALVPERGARREGSWAKKDVPCEREKPVCWVVKSGARETGKSEHVPCQVVEMNSADDECHGSCDILGVRNRT